MKKQFLAVGLLCGSVLAISARDADPVLMNVAGKDVRLSEFEYLFHKNNSQQVQPQSIDDYVGMFVDYKLKVADAEAAGIDTTAAFINEFTQFRDELSEPYMRDDAVLEAMVRQAYDHMKEELYVSHIMLPADKSQLMDSLRTAIIDGKATFEDVARKYSIDKPSAKQGGRMGYVVPNRFPWDFEKAAFDTPVGMISPVVNSGFGIHIIRPESRRPARGEVSAAHILRVTRNASDSVKARQKQLIDSIYREVSAEPSTFEDVARRLSEDPGSARNGGSLGWFGPGVMVHEFDSVSFALPVGQISAPFATAFGWHIIKKIDERGIGSLDDNKDKILKAIENSPRANAPREAYLDEQKKIYKASLYKDNIAKISDIVKPLGERMDSAVMAALSQSTLPLYTVDGVDYTLGEVASTIEPSPSRGVMVLPVEIENIAVSMMNDRVYDIAREKLLDIEPDYRNLVNEYRDGILLFEISNRNVWDRAAKDKAGLEKFFNDHRSDYKWDSPKFKSFVIFASSDSLLGEALKFATDIPADLAPADFAKAMRERFGRDIKVE
ncbi:MAG: peptidylprolyl isomerase, partial [Muribaculaceae bacterium]|nr:peptidylprolyl isomerase [Muribaculaceae bacterium]